MTLDIQTTSKIYILSDLYNQLAITDKALIVKENTVHFQIDLQSQSSMSSLKSNKDMNAISVHYFSSA